MRFDDPFCVKNPKNCYNSNGGSGKIVAVIEEKGPKLISGGLNLQENVLLNFGNGRNEPKLS